MVEGKYGWAPPGKSHLILGHESLGRVIDPGITNRFKKGDLVVGIVRRPIRFRVQIVQWVNGICVEMDFILKEVLNRLMVLCLSSGELNLNMQSRLILH